MLRRIQIRPYSYVCDCDFWASSAWRSLKHCLEHDYTSFPWFTDPGDCRWHEGNCSRHDADIVDIQVGPWAYVSFRGDNVEELPEYSTFAEILHDTSVGHHGLAIKAIVYSNVQEKKTRHFWLLEIENNKPVGLYNSLHGQKTCQLRMTKSYRCSACARRRSL